MVSSCPATQVPAGASWHWLPVLMTGGPLPCAAYFDQENRGKRSVVLDLKAPGGVDTLKMMLRDADVLITNVRSGPLERLGLDYRTLSKEMPHLVYAHLSAWGREGPDMNLPGYDVGAFFAAPGVSDMLRGSDDAALPRNLGAFGDHVTAIHLLSGIGLALFHKQRTGRGQLVDACLYRAAIFSAANWANVAHNDVQEAGPHTDNLNGMKNPREASGAVALMSYKTSDDHWIQLLGLDHDVHVPRICGAIGLPDDTWARCRDRGDPLTGQDVVAQIDEIFSTKTKDEWVEIFQQHDVWHTVVAKIDDMCVSRLPPRFICSALACPTLLCSLFSFVRSFVRSFVLFRFYCAHSSATSRLTDMTCICGVAWIHAQLGERAGSRSRSLRSPTIPGCRAQRGR